MRGGRSNGEHNGNGDGRAVLRVDEKEGLHRALKLRLDRHRERVEPYHASVDKEAVKVVEHELVEMSEDFHVGKLTARVPACDGFIERDGHATNPPAVLDVMTVVHTHHEAVDVEDGVVAVFDDERHHVVVPEGVRKVGVDELLRGVRAFVADVDEPGTSAVPVVTPLTRG